MQRAFFLSIRAHRIATPNQSIRDQDAPAFAFPIALFLAALTSGCGGDVVLPPEGDAANLEILNGDDQTAQAGAALTNQVVVRVTDSRDRPVQDYDVSFSIGSGGGSVSPTTTKTNSAGNAAAAWTLGPNVGDQLLRVQARRGGATTNLEVSFHATAIAGSRQRARRRVR